MLETIRTSLAEQYEGALCMLWHCVEKCPETSWSKPVANRSLDQVCFHALFYGDVYLSETLGDAQAQSFHQLHASVFEGYEELEDQMPTKNYSRAFIREYLSHCRQKSQLVIGKETTESLEKDPGFDWLPFCRYQVHIYNIRHLHHHAAQMSLRLRLDHEINVPWVGFRWREVFE